MHVRGGQFAFAHAGDGAAVTHGELAGQAVAFVHRGHSGLQGLALAQRLMVWVGWMMVKPVLRTVA